MIGNFARMLRGPPRAFVLEEADVRGEPPEQFVEKIQDEGGDVYVSPVLESLRAVLRRYLQPSPEAPEASTRSDGTERRP